MKAEPTAADMKAVADALQLMVDLRKELPYRSRGFEVLNGACHRLTDRFYAEIGVPRPGGSAR